MFILIYYLRWCSSLILLSGDIETNPGPTPSSGQCFSICHWNLNSITAHNFAKLSLLTVYNLVHSFDIICLSETYLNSKAPPNDTRQELPGYNLFRSDHPFFSIWVFFHEHFTIHRTAGAGGGYLFNSSLPLPPTSRTLRH